MMKKLAIKRVFTQCNIFVAQNKQLSVFIQTVFSKSHFFNQSHNVFSMNSEPEKKRLMPAELRVDTLRSELDDKQHPSVAMRALVLECMDKAIQLSHKAKYTNEQKDEFMLWDRVNNYKPLELPVSQRLKVIKGKWTLKEVLYVFMFCVISESVKRGFIFSRGFNFFKRPFQKRTQKESQKI